MERNGYLVVITINGKSRCFTPQLIAQLPNQSVIDFILAEFQ